MHYEKVFLSEFPSDESLHMVLSRIGPFLNNEKCDILLRGYTRHEVKNALFSMKPLKSPGPDGFPPFFYQEYWPLVGNEVADFLVAQLSKGAIENDLNQTCIVLIPKCSKPKDLTQLRPISLCTVLYRVLSKASVEEAQAFAEVIDLYCKASGQKVWKIFTETDSLLHQVYKSLYFNKGDFLEASATAKASYSWRSILAARDAIKEEKRKARQPGSSVAKSDTENRFWKILWKLKIANKDEDASLLHIFNKWPVAIQIWALSNLWSEIRPDEVCSIHDWMLKVLTKSDEEVAEKFLILLWALWKGRNAVVFDSVKTDPLSMMTNALSYWRDFKVANSDEGIDNTNRFENAGWMPPPLGVKKINVDASAVKNGGGGIGFVVRDSFGNFIEAVAQNIPSWEDPAVLEAFVIKEACKWAVQRGYQQVIIESDALEIVRLFHMEELNRSTVGIFVQEARMMMGGKNWKIVWTSRSSNQVAHLIATQARSCAKEVYWLKTCPEFIKQAIMQDKLSL